ncbi:MAG TPA: nucleotide sugar dehydrogenase [Firmicutes bacterium]|nr:nucleotide sugar dehydrogenase [Bacillota bacterium]
MAEADIAQDLEAKILSRRARIAVIGLGYVGLPLAIAMCKAGYHVVGIDINQDKLRLLAGGKSYVIDVPDSELQEAVSSGMLVPTREFDQLRDVDAVSICVPTPLRRSKDPDLSCLATAIDALKKYVHKGMLIILESTTYPGTTEELLRDTFEAMGYRAGVDLFICFSPERVDPGNPKFKTGDIPKIIGGISPRCTRLASLLYGSFISNIIPVSSTRTAEMVKLLENTFRSVNIALVNEMALLCERMGIDVWEVIDAASSKPFGFMPFYPGPGVGGHCIPLDPMYLFWRARCLDFYDRFIELASDINSNMPRHVVAKISRSLNRHRKCINGAKILILGVAYKRDVDDTRESPALEIYRLLAQDGASVIYHDPRCKRVFLDGEVIESAELTGELLESVDCVVLCTDHSTYDYEWIEKHSNLIVDTRNAFKGIKSSKIVKLGAPSIYDAPGIYEDIPGTIRFKELKEINEPKEVKEVKWSKETRGIKGELREFKELKELKDLKQPGGIKEAAATG